MGAIELTWFQVAISAGLVVVAGIVSLALRLGLEGRLAYAAVRTVVQLFLIGFVLKFVFGVDQPLMLVPVFAVMIGAASRAAVKRPSRTFKGVTWRAFITLVLSGLLTTFLVSRVVIQVHPWHKAQYVIPLLGMILGNSLTGISLCLDQLLERLSERRAEIEQELALGATKWEAAREVLGDAVKRGMIPVINAMMVVGIVSLPGMMTGQILAGENPVNAVKYQIVVMFMLAAATSMGCILMALLAYKRLFNSRHQLEARLIARIDH